VVFVLKGVIHLPFDYRIISARARFSSVVFLRE
jgi:hypothetical protein